MPASTKDDFTLEVFSALQKEKGRKILTTLSSSECCVNRIKLMSMSRYGLVDNSVRKKAWLYIHGIYGDELQNEAIDEHAIVSHKEYHQVLMDVNRSLKRFPPGMDEVVRMAMQDQLVRLIIRVLMNNKGLHYYQGFHDVCVTFLLVLSEEESVSLVSKLTASHFIDFMAPTMDSTMQLLYLIYAIVELENPAIIRKFNQVSLEPFFALPWVITWFGHVLGDLKRILRVYDFFLASDPIMPIYLSAAIVLHRHEEVSNTEIDFALLHHMLTNLPETMPIELLITDSMDLCLRHPPEKIIVSRTIPTHLTLRLTAIGSEILRRKKGPIGDGIDMRTRLSGHNHVNSNRLFFLTNFRGLSLTKIIILVTFFAALLSVIVRLWMNKFL